jgi:FAD:protein FMN transferase
MSSAQSLWKSNHSMNRVFIPWIKSTPLLPAAADVQSLSGETMGTTWALKLVLPEDVPPDEIQRAVQRHVDGIVAEMSTWLPASNLSRFNTAPADSVHDLPVDLCTVLDHALNVAHMTYGAYDPTIGPLVNRWGFGPPGRFNAMPEPLEISQLRERCGWTRLVLDPGRRTIVQPGGLYVDLSAIAKGFAVDRVAELLDLMGVQHFLLEIGGELRGQGIKPDGMPWWVALETALEPTLIALHQLSVATSGDYRRFYENGHVRYSHTIDPRSGRPIANGVACVSVLHESCMHADALSTALTVMGLEEGMAFAKRNGIAARFLLRKNYGLEERMTPAFAAMLD